MSLLSTVSAEDAQLPTRDESDETESAEDVETRVGYERFLVLLRRQPKLGTALDRVYGFHVERGTLSEFLTDLRNEAATAQDHGTTWMMVGLIEMQQSHDREAADAFRAAESIRPDDPFVRWYLGRSLIRLGSARPATEALERAIALKPQRGDLLQMYQELGRAYRRSQQADKATEVWTRMEQLFPSDVRVKEQIATTLQEEGDFDAALIRFTELASLHRDSYLAAQAALTAGELKVQLGRTEEALKDFEAQLRKLDPESWLYQDVRRRIEDVFRRTDDLAGLVAYYERWLSTHREDLDAMSRLGRTLAAQGRFVDARKWFTEALKLAPSNIAIREAMIEQLMREELYADAILQYEQLSLHDNGDADHIEEWGLLYLSRMDLPREERQAKASEIWQRLVQNRVDDASAVSRVADLLRRAELTEEAIRMYRQAISISPKEPQYREYLGDYLHALKRVDEAIAEWNAIAEGELRTTENLVHLAEILNHFGHEEKAIHAMGEACSLTPSFAEHIRFTRMLREFERDGTNPRAKESLTQLELADALSESAEDRQLVLEERIKSLTSSGLLKEQTRKLANELQNGNNPTATRWRTLALYLNADSQFPSAIEAINSSLTIEPNSVEAWTVAAALFEKAGRLADAVNANRKLTELDRRFLTEHLKKTATLQQRLGRFKDAQQTGKELIAAAPGNPEHSQFYADLCFQVGQKEEGLKTLRRAVRANLSDDSMVMSLATALAKAGETAEAIDLYWQAFERASDVDSRSSITASLAEIHFSTNQFDRLIQKLEQRGKERNQQRDSAICLATAFRVAGDLKSARQKLESLLTTESRDIALLDEISMMAEKEGDLESAADYQRRINIISSTQEGRTRLANLLLKLGDVSEAEALLARVSDAATSPHEVVKALDKLIEIESFDGAKQLCDRVLERDAKNWEVLIRLGIVEWRTGHKDKAGECFDRVLALNLSAETPSAEVEWALARKAMVNPSTTVAQNAVAQYGVPPFLQRIRALDDIRVKLGETSEDSLVYRQTGPGRAIQGSTGSLVYISNGGVGRQVFSGQQIMTLQQKSHGVLCSDYGAARVFSIGARYLSTQEIGDSSVFVQQLEQRADLSTQGAWDAFYLHEFMSTGEANKVRTLSDSQRLAKKGDLEGQAMYLLHCGGQDASSPFLFHVGVLESFEPTSIELSAEQIELMISSFESVLAKKPDWTYVLEQRHLLAVCRENRCTDQIEAMIQRLSAEGSSHQQLTVALELATAMEKISIDDALAKLDRIGGLITTETGLPWTSNGRALSTLQSVVKLAGRMGTDASLMTLSWWLERKAKSPALATTMLRTATYAARRNAGIGVRPPVSGRFTPSTYQSQNIDYPAFPAYYSDADIYILAAINSSVTERSKISSWCDEQRRTATGRHAVFVELATSSFFWWDELKSQSIVHLIRAVELAPEDTRLRLKLVELCQMTSKSADALALLEQPPENDPELLKIFELKAITLAMTVGNKDRARQAAERLCGLQLDAESGQLLIKHLAKLEMKDRLDEVTSRLQTAKQPPTRAVSQGELLDLYEKQGNTQAAVQVARQLIRRMNFSPAPQPGRTPTAKDTQQLRERAVKILKASGEMDKMMERQKAQIAKSPNSKLLLQTLLEYQQIAGRKTDAEETRKRLISLQSAKSLESLLEAAQNLQSIGRKSEACDKWLELMRLYPAASLQPRLEVPVELFIKANRVQDLVAALIRLLEQNGLQGSAHEYIVALISELSKDVDRHAELALVLDRILEAQPDHARLLLLSTNPQVWQKQELLPVLSKLYLPASEADVHLTYRGWPNHYTGSTDYFGTSADLHTSITSRYQIFWTAVQAKDCRDALKAQIAESQRTYPDWAGGELLLALAELKAAELESSRKKDVGGAPTFDKVVEQIQKSLDRPDARIPEVVAFEIASFMAQHTAIKAMAVPFLQRSILQTPEEQRSLCTPAATLMVRLFAETKQFEQGRDFVQKLTPSESDPRSGDARRGLWSGSRIAAAYAMASLKDPIASFRLLKGITIDDETAYFQAISHNTASRSSPRRTTKSLLDSMREIATREITPAVISKSLSQRSQTSNGEVLPQLDLGLTISQRQGGIFILESDLLKELGKTSPSTASQAILQELATNLSEAMRSDTADDSLILVGLHFLVTNGVETALMDTAPALEAYLANPIPASSSVSETSNAPCPHEQQLAFACLADTAATRAAANPQFRRFAELFMERSVAVARQHPDHRYLQALLYKHGEMLSAAGKLAQAEKAWSEMLDHMLASSDVMPDLPVSELPGRTGSGVASRIQSPKVDISEELRKKLLAPATTK